MAACAQVPVEEPGAAAVHPVVAPDTAVGRAAARLGIGYVLRTLQLIAHDGGGDLLTAIVLYGVLAANVGYLDRDPNHPSPYSAIEDVPPDTVRRPVSILGVANSLGLPYETTRRRVSQLIARGHLIRVKGGVIGPGATLRGPIKDREILTNVANLRRLFRALRSGGLDLD
jgi:hypothetical protein